MSNEKRLFFFFYSFRTCNLIGRLKKTRNGAMVAQEDNKVEIEIQGANER